MATKKKKNVKKLPPAKSYTKKPLPKKAAPLPAPAAKKHTIYIHHSAFQPTQSVNGVIDNFQSGRHTAVPDRSLAAPIILPVGAKIKSMSIYYTNSTGNTPIATFLRLHVDRHCPSGEIEMSFFGLAPGVLPPDNYLTLTDTTFPDGGLIKKNYLHYLEINGTGNFGAGGILSVRGASITYTY